MSKFLLVALAPCLSFGPLFMTNMGGTASGSGIPISMIGSFMVIFGLVTLFRHMMKQDQLIKEMKSQIGNTNEQTAS